MKGQREEHKKDEIHIHKHKLHSIIKYFVHIKHSSSGTTHTGHTSVQKSIIPCGKSGHNPNNFGKIKNILSGKLSV